MLGLLRARFDIVLYFFLVRFSLGASKARDLKDADCIRLVPHIHRGKGDIVRLNKQDAMDLTSYSFNYQRDTYIISSVSPIKFTRLPYPCSSRPPISSFFTPRGLLSSQLLRLTMLYGRNEFYIPIPSFSELFIEHATAPFFVFQVFCVALWCLDEYWYYSLFTFFMLIMFECTVVWQARFPILQL
jgi:manganese-transporting P-type ATPase